MSEENSSKEHVSIWVWVGMVLCTFGILVLGTGLFHLAQPPTTILGNLRPRIWWGSFMIVTGLLFLVPEIRSFSRFLRDRKKKTPIS